MTKQEFDLLFKDNYSEITYDDVKDAYCSYFKELNGKIFHDDYQTIDKDTFLENLSDDAKFQFQDILLESFYDKNPLIYESAFEIFESNNGQKSDVTKSFDDCYMTLYDSFVCQLADEQEIFS